MRSDSKERALPTLPPPAARRDTPSGTGSWREALRSLRAGASLLRELPGFLRRGLDDETAVRELRARRARRGERFLDFVQRAIWSCPESPYRGLLAHAGCRPGDLQELVRREGVEGALSALHGAGVYVTLEELKGSLPIRRGSWQLAAGPESFRPPGAPFRLSIRSGGTSAVRTPVAFDLRYLREIAVNYRLARRCRQPPPTARALWLVPGAGELCVALGLAAAGLPVDRRFSQIDVGAGRLHARYRWSDVLVRFAARLGGRRYGAAVFAPIDDPASLLDWLARELASGGRPALDTFPSSAVRLVEAAERAGISLAGTQLGIGGEPCTPARVARLRAAGLEPRPNYGAAEAAAVFAEACLAPAREDEVHLFRDLFALVQPAAETPGLPADALLMTSFARFAPLVLLNASLGDRARLTRRACGCPLAAHGWDVHLDGIRSFRRVTVGGMALLDSALETLLETVLPARHGGCATDYQLIEEEGRDGGGRLRLLVHPHVGALSEPDAIATFLAALAERGGVEAIAAEAWAGALVVERRAPRTTAGGKVHSVWRQPDRERRR